MKRLLIAPVNAIKEFVFVVKHLNINSMVTNDLKVENKTKNKLLMQFEISKVLLVGR